MRKIFRVAVIAVGVAAAGMLAPSTSRADGDNRGIINVNDGVCYCSSFFYNCIVGGAGCPPGPGG